MPVTTPPGGDVGGAGGTAQLPPASLPSSGPVTPLEVYELLLNAGYSTVQAVGIMANAINESGIDPESVGDSGTSFGFVQFHEPGYAGAHTLVTGNPQADIRAQITYLAQHTTADQVAGATGAEVAGNFASRFEECVGCQPGQSQYNGRVANAARVLGWVSSNAWPQSAGGGGGGAGGGAGAGNGCLIEFPGIAGLGSVCLFRTSWARALTGGALLAVAVPVGLVGAIILAAFGFRQTGAGRHVAGAAEAAGAGLAVVPGLQGAGAAVAAIGSAEARAGRRQEEARAGREQSARERREGRQFDEVMARRRDSARGPAVREDESVPF